MIYNNVKIWLYVGLIMVFLQIVIGSTTRLTESGLSITKWDVITGTLPPLNDADWEKEFDLYKDSPQYKEINEGMSIENFKYIYFWEYIHRLWARIIGFVFIIPFLYFYFTNRLDKALLKNLGVVVIIAAVTAVFGWIMVASGLINRPWVNAYKLSIHLVLGFSVFLYLLYTVHDYVYSVSKDTLNVKYGNFSLILILLWFQVILGGAVSGMKSAVLFPTWPDMNGSLIPAVLFETSQYTLDNFVIYDNNELIPALIHFLHRVNAYILLVIILYFALKNFKNQKEENKFLFLIPIFVLVLQLLLGILTVLYSVGKIPVGLGVLHQVGALFLVSSIYIIYFRSYRIVK
jgi:heme a synthase